jgi:hypothetical protein
MSEPEMHPLYRRALESPGGELKLIGESCPARASGGVSGGEGARGGVPWGGGACWACWELATEGAVRAPGNGIGDAGAAALAKALASGQCALTSLNLRSECCHARAGGGVSWGGGRGWLCRPIGRG